MAQVPPPSINPKSRDLAGDSVNVGARLKSLFEEQAKQRQQAGRVNGGSVKPLSNHKDNIEALVPQPSRDPQSRDLAGDSVNVGARLKSLFEEQAKKRQIEAAKIGGRKTEDDYQRSSVTKVEKKVPALVPEPSVKGDSRDLAGDSVNVGARLKSLFEEQAKNRPLTPPLD